MSERNVISLEEYRKKKEEKKKPAKVIPLFRGYLKIVR